jgi:hypothetical protein
MSAARRTRTAERYAIQMTENRGFELRAHFLQTRRSVRARPTGLGWQVETDADRVEVRTLEQAVRIAEQHIGELLRRVGRRPGWGLSVIAGSASAFYGEPDPMQVAVPGGRGASPDSLVARIRSRWKQGDSPVSALQNALQIVRGYLGRSGRRAAA